MKEHRIPFDPDAQSLWCSRCGSKLEKSGHMFSEFLLCPRHGEFTIAPVVMRVPERIMGPPPTFEAVPNPSPDAGRWFMHVDETTAGDWANCDAIDARHQQGEPYDPRESRVL